MAATLNSKHAGDPLVPGYVARSETPDTMVGPDGGVAPSWRALAEQLGQVAPDELDHRATQATQILEEGTLLSSRPGHDVRLRWPLDPVPFQLSAAEFDPLAAGVAQRARLLNRIVEDLLGKQRALAEKIIPPALLFANPHYFRSCHGLPVSHGRYVHLCATDVVRGPGGEWWALGDLTNAPPGLGFLLENRIASARVHADWFQRVPVSRLAPSLELLEQTLARLAPRNRRNPRIVLLGHRPETARGVEDEFLARYLGYSLVVGDDLAVRGGQTVLKTLGGPVPVEVILRRIDDDACDPVELRPDAIEGIAGLVESQRQNQVSIANMLGSQLAEAPALRAFLGPLARFYEGEELQIPSAATWWCGHPQELQHVIENLDDLTVLNAFDRATAPIDGRALSKSERNDLIRRIRAEPEQFVGQERPVSSTTPGWTNGRLEPHLWSLRAFSILDEDTPRPVRGGLIRLHADDVPEPDLRTGGRLQDCWVQSTRPARLPALAPATEDPIVITRGGAELPSRVAETLYWLGRRVEAVEDRARLSRGLLVRCDQAATEAANGNGTNPEDASSPSYWHRFLGFYGDDRARDRTWTSRAAERAIRDDLLGESSGSNLSGVLDACYQLARAVRDRVSLDAWRVVARTERRVARTVARTDRAREGGLVASLLDDLVLDTAAFAGFVNENMTRTLAWRFLDIGRRVERAMHVSRLLRAALADRSDEEVLTLEFLLEVCDSTATYRSRYLADVRLLPTLDLLVIDETNPRSIAFQLATLTEHLSQLPRETPNGPLDPDRRTALALLDAARLADPEALVATDPSGRRGGLEALLTRIIDELPIVERALSAKYLIHAELPKQFTAVSPRSTGGDSGGDAGRAT